MKESAVLLRRDTVQDLFKGYYYDQSFEGFSFSIEEKVKPIVQKPVEIVPPRRTAHRSLQLSPKSTITRSNSRSNSNTSKPNIPSAKNIELMKPKKESQKYLPRYRPSSKPKEIAKNQSRNAINFKAAGKYQALPKGPFYYKNESKKISQI